MSGSPEERIERTNRWIRLAVGAFLALVLLIVSLTCAGVYVVSSQNRVSLRVVLAVTGCTPSDTAEECRKRQTDQSAETIRQLTCLNLLTAGYRPPDCADVGEFLAGLPRSD